MEGIYRHYKGGIYEVIGEGMHTETEDILVFYKDTQGNLWARPTEMFKETVVIDGETINRFDKVK